MPLDAFWMGKQEAQQNPEHRDPSDQYRPIETPRSSPIGFINAFFAVVTGFALIWHIWWMAGLGLIGAFMAFLLFAFRDEEEVTVPVERIVEFERRRQAEARAMSTAVTIDEVGHQALPSASEAGPAPKRIVVAYGFWIFSSAIS